MEPTNSKDGIRRQRTPEEIIKLLEEFDKSEGITVKEYCAMIGVSDAAFYGWRKMYGSKADAEEKPSGFIELISDTPSPNTPQLFAEVKIVRLYQPVASDYFKSMEL